MLSKTYQYADPIGPECFDILEERGHVGVWSWDLRSDQVSWSNGLHRIMGLVPGAVVPSRELFYELMHPDDRPLQFQRARSMREGLAVNFDFRVIRPNGAVRWMTTKTETLTDREGNPLRVIGVVFDITARKLVEGALDASEERFRALARAAERIVWSAQPDGTLEILSDPLGLLGGRQDVSGLSLPTLVAHGDRERVARAWAEGVREAASVELECRMAAPLDEGATFHLRAVPVRSADGAVREWIGTFGLAGGRMGAPASQDAQRRQPTGAQLRAARGMLNWSVRRLAEAADVSVATIRRLEERDGAPASFEPKLERLRDKLESAGVTFVFSSDGKAGVGPA